MMDEKQLQDAEGGIDFSIIFQALWKRKRLFAITGTISIVIGVIVALGIPKTYESKVVLAPEITSSSGLSSNLSDLASMVGVQIGSGSGNVVDAIYPELYPEIVRSSPFVADLFDIHVSTQDGTLKDITLYEYFEQHQQIPWWSKAMGGAMRMFSKKKPAVATQRKTNSLRFSEAEEGVAGAIRRAVNCGVDRKTSIITINVTAQDPLVAATIADSVQRRLQEYVTNYRTKKARADLAYTERIYAQAKKDYEKSQQDYTAYADANAELLLESFIAKRDELENEMQLRYNIYNQLSQQIQAARAKVQENTPAFTQIQPAQVASMKAGPKRGLIVMIWLVLALFFTTLYVIVAELREKGKEQAEDASPTLLPSGESIAKA